MSEQFYNARNLVVSNGFVKNPNRYYLEEFFNQLPAKNGDVAYTKNINFEILGTNAVSSDIGYSATNSGITLTTAGADNDQVILLPHLDTGITAWTGVQWKTQYEVEWECALSVANISNVAFWAGLKYNNVPTLATNDDQAYFFFDSDDSVVGNITTNANLHFCYSVGGTDYTTNLGIAVEADTTYRLRIVIDNNRKISVFVNEQQYGLTQTSGSAGVTESTETQKSLQMTNNISLIPYIGVQSTTAEADVLTVGYEKISRNLSA